MVAEQAVGERQQIVESDHALVAFAPLELGGDIRD